MEISPIRPMTFGMRGISRAMFSINTATQNIANGSRQPSSDIINSLVELKASELSYDANGKVIQTSFDMMGVLFDELA